jgi:hypothetical protein
MMSDSLAGFAAGVFSIGMIIVCFPSTSNRLLLCCSPAGFCFFPCFDEKSTI